MPSICLWTGWERVKKVLTYPDWNSFCKSLKVSCPLRNLMLNMSQITLTFRRTFPSSTVRAKTRYWLSISFQEFCLTLSRKISFSLETKHETPILHSRKNVRMFRVVGKMKICVQTSSRKWNEDVLVWNECMIFKLTTHSCFTLSKSSTY